MCLILRNFSCDPISVGNIKRLQVADYISFNGYTMNIDEVIDNFNTALFQVELEANFSATNVNEKLESQTIQRQTLGMTQTKLDYTKRLVLRDLRDRKMCAVFLDNNDNYQFIGELGAYLREDDNTTANSTYTIVIEAISRNSMRQLTQALGETISQCVTCNCSLYQAEFAITSNVSTALIQDCQVDDFLGTL